MYTILGISVLPILGWKKIFATMETLQKVYITEFHYFLAKKQNVYFNQQDWSSKTKVGLLTY